MNILQINKFFFVCDGTSRYFFNVSKLLKKKGHKIHYFSMQHPYNYKSKSSKYFPSYVSFRNFSLLNSIKMMKRMFYSQESKMKINDLLSKTKKIDVAHIHSIYHHLSPSILPEFKKRKIPVVMTVEDYHLISPNYLLFHDNYICEITKPNLYYKALLHKCVKNSYIATFLEVVEKYLHKNFQWEIKNIDLFITPSKFMKKKLEEYGIKSSKISVLPHYLDFNQYKPNYDFGNYVLFFGRLYEEKGLMFLMEVINLLPKIQFVIMGEGPERAKIMKYIKEKKMKNLKLIRWSDGSKLKKYICNSRFTIIPSKWFEGFGLTIIESYACGKPVIGSNIGGIPEVIHHGETGLIFEPNNIEDCKKKIFMLWNNLLLVKKMGLNARNLVKENFGPDTHYKNLLQIYNKLILHT